MNTVIVTPRSLSKGGHPLLDRITSAGYGLAYPSPGAQPTEAQLEAVVGDAVGWIAGYPNAFPKSCMDLWRAATAGDLARALPLYRRLHPLLRWDAKTEFVQAIKRSMDLVGRYGGPCRLPRVPLTAEQDTLVVEATQAAIAAGLA